MKLGLVESWLDQKLGASDTLTVSNSSSNSNMAGSSASVAMSLNEPTAAYTGKAELYVYVDKVYKTLMFSHEPPDGQSDPCP